MRWLTILSLLLSLPAAARAQGSCLAPPSTCEPPPAGPIARTQRPATVGIPDDTPTQRALLEAITLEERATAGEFDALLAHRAIQAYEDVLRRSPSLDRMRLGDAHPTWPTEYGIRLTMATLSQRLQDWPTCHRAFDALVTRYPRGERVEEALHGAALCASGATGAAPERPRGGGRRAPEPELRERALTPLERGAAASYRRFLCRVPQHVDAVTVRYRLGRLLYEANHYEEAAQHFRAVAFDHPDQELGGYAASLYIDSLHSLATRGEGRNAACLSTLTDAIDPLTSSYCGDEAHRRAHQSLCGLLQQLRCDHLRLSAERLSEEGQHARAAHLYVDIATHHRECGRLDEVLYNAALEYEAQRDITLATATRDTLVRNFPESALVPRALWRTASNHHALADYEEAATRYEAFAERYPMSVHGCTAPARAPGGCPDARDALENAIFMRSGLGQTDRVIADAQRYERYYGRTYPERTAGVWTAVVLGLARRARWTEVREHARHWLAGRPIGAGALRVRRALARAHAALGSRAEAEALWREIAATDVDEVLRSGPTPSSERDLALARVRAHDVVAEARLRMTDRDTETFLARHAPPRDAERWLQTRQEELASLTERLERVREEQIPEHTIAAAARLAELHEHLARETAAVRRGAAGAEPASAPRRSEAELRERAASAYEFCSSVALRVRWPSEISRGCAAALTRLAPDRHPEPHELTGRASWPDTRAPSPPALGVDDGPGDAE